MRNVNESRAQIFSEALEFAHAFMGRVHWPSFQTQKDNHDYRRDRERD
jgi:hypothetical protein